MTSKKQPYWSNVIPIDVIRSIVEHVGALVRTGVESIVVATVTPAIDSCRASPFD